MGGGGSVFVGGRTGVSLGGTTTGVSVGEGGGVHVNVNVTVGVGVLVGMLNVAVGGSVQVGQGVAVGHGVKVGRGGTYWPGVASVPPISGVGVAQKGGSGVIVGKRLAVAVGPIRVSTAGVVASGCVGVRRVRVRSGASPSNIAPAQ